MKIKPSLTTRQNAAFSLIYMHWYDWAKNLWQGWLQLSYFRDALQCLWQIFVLSKTRFGYLGCSMKDSKCAHASLHMLSVSSLSSLHLSLPPFLLCPLLEIFRRPWTVMPTTTRPSSAQRGTALLGPPTRRGGPLLRHHLASLPAFCLSYKMA